ncbi:hypothetical protein AX15_002198 [Amanita polypyramis BW_CC]|nr:hypothetical protein AX15_002198 [Amanita polypyramis BW_CC]
MNELKRRDAVINTLQERIKTLESTIARMLRERGTDTRSEMKSLVNLSLWMSSSPQDGLNSVTSHAAHVYDFDVSSHMQVDVQIPTIEPLHLNARTSGPTMPCDETPFTRRAIAVTNKIYDGDGDDMKQVPALSKLSEPDSGDDDDVPLSELTRLSPTPNMSFQGVNKRERAPSPAAAKASRPARRLVS